MNYLNWQPPIKKQKNGNIIFIKAKSDLIIGSGDVRKNLKAGIKELAYKGKWKLYKKDMPNYKNCFKSNHWIFKKYKVRNSNP